MLAAHMFPLQGLPELAQEAIEYLAPGVLSAWKEHDIHALPFARGQVF